MRSVSHAPPEQDAQSPACCALIYVTRLSPQQSACIRIDFVPCCWCSEVEHKSCGCHTLWMQPENPMHDVLHIARPSGPPSAGPNKNSSSLHGAMGDMVPKDKLMSLVSSAQVRCGPLILL